MSKQNEFISKLIIPAQLTEEKYGVYASVTIAQAIIESAWGSSKLVKTDNNLFGIKINGTHGVQCTRGSYATDDGGYYAHYNTVQDSIEDHGYFLRNNIRYFQAGVFDTGITAAQQIERIMNAGYASASYAATAKLIMHQYNLTIYDNNTTKTEIYNIMYLQHELNIQNYRDKNGNKIIEDGIPGPLTLSALPLVKEGARGNITRYIQAKTGAETDGIYGPNTKIQVMQFQAVNGLRSDGIVGPETWKKLINYRG